MQAEPQLDQAQVGEIQMDIKFKTESLAEQYAKDMGEDYQDYDSLQSKVFWSIDKPVSLFNPKLRPYIAAFDKYIGKEVLPNCNEFDDWGEKILLCQLSVEQELTINGESQYMAHLLVATKMDELRV